MHPVLVAERLRASSRRPRHPFLALMAGVNPGPVPVHRALPATKASFMPHEAVAAVTSTTAQEELARPAQQTSITLSMSCNWGSTMIRQTVGLHNLCNRVIDHHVQQLKSHCGPTKSLDRGKPPLSLNKDVNDLHDKQTGTSITLWSNWEISVVR